MNNDEFVKKVIAFYEEEGRNFLWRQKEDPYAILVAEMLLVKTQAGQVEPVYEKLLARYPSVRDLAKANIKNIGGITDVLGLSYRKNHLKRMAKSVVNSFGGKIPEDSDSLLNLYGVGRYIANAVLCFAFEKSMPIVDVNTSRVLSEVFDIVSEGRPRENKELWSKAGELVPRNKCKEYNWGLLDLGAKISPRNKERKTVKDILREY